MAEPETCGANESGSGNRSGMSLDRLLVGGQSQALLVRRILVYLAGESLAVGLKLVNMEQEPALLLAE